MANLQSSFMHSSVGSYKNVEALANNQNNNFIKYLHINTNFEKSPYEEEQHPQSTPIIKRYNSLNSFASKPLTPRLPEKTNAFHNRFYQTMNSNSPSKNTANFAALHHELIKSSAKQIAFNTQKELFAKEIKRLKEEIDYLNDKCQDLQKKNQYLMGCKQRVEILDRQYKKLLKEYDNLRDSCRAFNCNYTPEHIPLSLQHINHQYNKPQSFVNYKTNQFNKLQSHLLKGKEVSSRIIHSPNQRTIERINWKKVTGQSPSPIYKIEQYRTGFKRHPYDQLPLMQSKVDTSEDNFSREEIKQENSFYRNKNVPIRQQGRKGAIRDDSRSGITRDEARYNPKKATKEEMRNVNIQEQSKNIDLRYQEGSKLQQFQNKCRELQQQLVEVRKKNIQLYKRFQKFQGEKLMSLENEAQLKYQNAKQLTDFKQKEAIFRREIEHCKLQSQSVKIKVIQLNEQINNDSAQLSLYRIQKEQIQNRQKQLKEQLTKLIEGKQNDIKSSAILRKMQQKFRKMEKQFNDLKSNWAVINQKNQQIQIEKSLLQHELQEKKQAILQLQKQLGVISKTKNKVNQNEINQLDQESNQSRNIQQDQDKSQLLKLKKNLQNQREEYKKITRDRQMYEAECIRLRNQNIFLSDNCNKLTKIFELQKQDNLKLNQLRQSWRDIEKKVMEVRRIDTAVDHLWQIKQIQYDNINTILQHLLSHMQTK